jgi:hypothetical protein
MYFRSSRPVFSPYRAIACYVSESRKQLRCSNYDTITGALKTEKSGARFAAAEADQAAIRLSARGRAR